MQTLRHHLVLVLLCLVFFVPGLTSTPPLDRDEARYIQATKQMFETGDFIDIRFQKEPRYKKPIGIYWLQSASVVAFSGGDLKAVWAYRLPSVLGAIASVLLTFQIAAVFLNKRAALLAGGFMAASILLIAEAHQAKTDAVLLAVTLACQLVIAKLYASATPELWPRLADSRISKWYAILFWVCLGASILVKGPVGLMIVGLTVIGVSVAARGVGWLRPLVSWPGIALFLIIVLPWFIAVTIKSGGAFFTESVGKDLMAKVASGQESHGAWPGYYLALLALTLWPASLFVWPAIFGAAKLWRTALIRFLGCWVIPCWVILELVPTKLPHYVLALYPALVILAAAAVSEHAGILTRPLASIWTRVYSLIWGAVGLALAVAAMVLPFQYGQGFSLWSLPVMVLALAAGAVPVMYLWKEKFEAAAIAAIGLGGLAAASVFQFTLPDLTDLNVSHNLAVAISEADPSGERPVFSSGYGEPSLIFLVGTETETGAANDAAEFLKTNADGIAAVDIRGGSQFLQAADARGLVLEQLGRVAGFNYSKGRKVDIGLYQVKPDE